MVRGSAAVKLNYVWGVVPDSHFSVLGGDEVYGWRKCSGGACPSLQKIKASWKSQTDAETRPPRRPDGAAS